MRKYWLYIIILLQIMVVGSLVRGIVTTLQSSRRLDDLIVRRDNLIAKRDLLIKKSQELTSEYYIEKVAREQLHLVKEGETIVMVPDFDQDDGRSSLRSDDSDQKPNWQKWYEVFLRND